MKITLSLIRSFLPLDLPPAKIGEVLTLLGIEVDKIHPEAPPFAGVVVGEVLSAKRHPEAEKLQVVQVSDGEKTFILVCGDPKCRAGMKTAFAQIGAVLPGRRIEKTKIRGIESEGMLCSEAELGLSDDHAGILDLPAETQTGEDLLTLLWDPVFELSLTPNLGHCMSALGIARELSAALQIPLKKREATPSDQSLDKEVIIRDPSLCPRYAARLIEGVDAGPSPFWLKRQLEAMGQKSINRAVDCVNYVMLKMGQPMHAFDADLLEGKKLTIAPLKEAAPFLGLDGVERILPAGSLVISDAQKPVALAGIMGGANSAVSDKTTRILLEAAYFDPLSIRNTAKKVGLRTESSQRFEKGVDPLGLLDALDEVTQLLQGKVKGTSDCKRGNFPSKTISYRPTRINQLLGTHLSVTEIEEIFQRLNFKVSKSHVEVPPYRADISEEIDLVEEVARIYGYNHLEKATPRSIFSSLPNDPLFLFENELRRRLTGLGLTEFLTCDLISPKLAEVARAITPPSMGFLAATYAKTEEYSILRTSLLPGLLQVTKKNLDQKNMSFAAFELGRIHFQQESKAAEIPMGAILLTGKANPSHWSQESVSFDFFDLKGLIENLISAQFIPSKHLPFHPGRQADIHVGDLIVGSLGEIHPHLLETWGIDQPVYYAELDLLHLLQLRKTHFKMTPLSQFPASERDWTLPLELDQPADLIFQAIASFASPLLERAELIDLYFPEGAKQKNLTFRFTYRDLAKTISFEEVEKEHGQLIQNVREKLQL